MRAQARNRGILPNWREAPQVGIPDAAAILGLSAASIYSFAAQGRLKLMKLGGRSLVDVSSLIALLDTREPWTPSTKPRAAQEARGARAAARSI